MKEKIIVRSPMPNMPTKEREGITIRQLYELAKEHGIEDMPLNITYFCNDDWYSFTNRTFTKDMFDTETGNICFED